MLLLFVMNLSGVLKCGWMFLLVISVLNGMGGMLSDDVIMCLLLCGSSMKLFGLMCMGVVFVIVRKNGLFV